MKSLKNHFGVIFPLVALLFCIQFITLVNKTIDDYEKFMAKDYSIIVVSSNDLNETALKPVVRFFDSMQTLGAENIINRLSDDISAKNIADLKKSLPKFYLVKLERFPSTEIMHEIRDKISRIKGVSRVEVFEKTHDKIYKTLHLIKKISEIFSILILVIGLMLLFKQMRIWLYEHKERIDIMSLFGASFWLKSGVLYRIAVVDSFIATIIVVALYIAMPNLEPVIAMMKDVGIELPSIDIIKDTAILLGISLVLSIVSVSFVMQRAKKEIL